MKSINDKLRYVEIVESNILFATQIEMTIFPGMCGYLSYRKAYEKGEPYFLVYFNNNAIGITGLYQEERLGEKNTVWLGWYGILPEYRKLGLGKTILLDSIEEAKKRGFDTFRLYTSVKNCPVACKLYDKVMDIGEDYTLEETEMLRKVYSKSLTNKKVVNWNNRYLYLTENHAEEDSAFSLFEEQLKMKDSNTFKEKDIMKLNKYEIKNYTVNLDGVIYSILISEGNFPCAEKLELISSKSKDGVNDYTLNFEAKENKLYLSSIYCNKKNIKVIADVSPEHLDDKSIYSNLNIILKDCSLCLVSKKIDFIKNDYPFDSPLNFLDIKYLKINNNGEVNIIDLSEIFDKLRKQIDNEKLELIEKSYKELLNNTPFRKEIELILPFEDYYDYSRLKN